MSWNDVDLHYALGFCSGYLRVEETMKEVVQRGSVLGFRGWAGCKVSKLDFKVRFGLCRLALKTLNSYYLLAAHLTLRCLSTRTPKQKSFTVLPIWKPHNVPPV